MKSLLIFFVRRDFENEKIPYKKNGNEIFYQIFIKIPSEHLPDLFNFILSFGKKRLLEAVEANEDFGKSCFLMFLKKMLALKS